MLLAVDVGDGGRVAKAAPASDGVKSPILLACLTEAAATWTIAGLESGSTVILPLVFPYIVSGYAFAFVLSLNEYIVAYMVVGFTVETHDGDGVIMGEGLRTAHSADYIRAAVATAGLSLAHLQAASPRTEDKVPVRGLVIVAAKT